MSEKRIDRKNQCDTDTEAPWVDLKRLAHIGGDAHELTQHERRLLCLSLSDDELHRCRVHAITQRCNHAEVGSTQQSIKFVLLDCLVTANCFLMPDNQNDEK
jgi:hypothetical protein